MEPESAMPTIELDGVHDIELDGVHDIELDVRSDDVDVDPPSVPCRQWCYFLAFSVGFLFLLGGSVTLGITWRDYPSYTNHWCDHGQITSFNTCSCYSHYTQFQSDKCNYAIKSRTTVLVAQIFYGYLGTALFYLGMNRLGILVLGLFLLQAIWGLTLVMNTTATRSLRARVKVCAQWSLLTILAIFHVTFWIGGSVYVSLYPLSDSNGVLVD